MNISIGDEDDAIRRAFKKNEEFLDWVWSRNILGKIALVLYLLTSVSPSLFNGFAIYFLWFNFYPMAGTLTERLAVLGVLIALANAEVLAIRWFLLQVMTYAYVSRRRRRRKTEASSE